MKYLNKFFLTALMFLNLSMVGLALVPAPVLAADARTAVCQGLSTTGGSCNPPGAGEPTVQNTVRTVVNILSFVVGVISVIMIIIGGLKYITSGGDSTSVNNAKNTILYAVVGLVVVAMAQVVVRYVINQVSQ